jgi:hypothetical protein
MYASVAPQQRMRPSRSQPKNPRPQLKLHRIGAASDRLRVADPRVCRARQGLST